jgi:hypothetical protein
MVNVSEHLIKTVIHIKPKMLSGLDQKGERTGVGVAVSPTMGVAPPVDRVDLNRSKSRMRNAVSPMSSLWVARPQGNVMGQWVKESGKSECQPVMGRTGVDPGGKNSTRKRADFHLVSLYEIVC